MTVEDRFVPHSSNRPNLLHHRSRNVERSEPGIAGCLPRNTGAPTEASLVSWLLLTTIYDRPIIVLHEA